ncbi:hypothetical protein D3C76_1187010 [compost metagenome]
MFGGVDPGHQRWVQADTFTGFGEQPLERDKAVVTEQHAGRPVQALDPATEGGTAGIAELSPDFVQGQIQFIGRCTSRSVGSDHAPMHLRRTRLGQITDHRVTRRLIAT